MVIGFAAETENILINAKSKLKKKGCDFIVANDVSLGTQTMGGDENTAILVSEEISEQLPTMSKRALAETLVEKISQSLRKWMLKVGVTWTKKLIKIWAYQTLRGGSSWC